MSTIIKSETSSHWYAADGTPAYGATLREARKQNLLPSVTTILKAWPAPQLEVWKQEQILLAALTMPEAERAKHPDLHELAQSIIASSREEAAKAADWGTRMHDAVTTYLTTKTAVDGEMGPWLAKFVEWYDANVAKVRLTEQVVVNTDHGYAGRIDAVVNLKNGQVCLWDIKCRSVKKGKPAVYDSMVMQLAAYHTCLARAGLWCNEFISMTINRDAPEAPYIYSWSPDEVQEGMDNWALCRKVWQATLGRGYSYDPNFEVKEAAHG